MYGMAPSSEVDCTALGLRPALSWHSYVSHVKSLEPGRRIGYGGTFVTTRQTRVATVPAGYADGYRRSLSNGFHVLIRGKKAPILGKICMDQMMVDVTDIPGVQVDDPVVLVGRDGNLEITMEENRGTGWIFSLRICLRHQPPGAPDLLPEGPPAGTGTLSAGQWVTCI